MKLCRKRIKLSLFAMTMIASLFIASFPADAEETLQQKGKLRFKHERISERDFLTGQEASANMETELEKIAPDLFHESTKETIEMKQTEKIEEQAELERNLFLQPHEENVVLKETEAALFASDYAAPKMALGEQDVSSGSDSASTSILASLAGVALAICGGIYAFLRRAFE